MDIYQAQKVLIFNYYVIFRSDNIDLNYRAIVPKNSYDSTKSMHILDYEIDGIIPALWYILHLPRMGFDVIENGIDLVIHSHDEPHNIIPLPYSKENESLVKDLIKNPSLIICEDEIYNDIICLDSVKDSVLGIKRVSELNSKLLIQHWKDLSKRVCNSLEGVTECIVDNSFRLISDNEKYILPLLPLANQLDLTNQLMEEITQIIDHKNYINVALAMRKRILDIFDAVAKEDEEFRIINKKDLHENPNFNIIPLVITMPGIMKYQMKLSKRTDVLPKDEEKMIDILGIHRAMAKNALYFDLPHATGEMYDLLDKLEEHCKISHKTNNKFIWKTLRRLGEILNEAMVKFDFDIIKYVSQITVFSDFPIGLAILPGCSAPICCIKPISYRPLTPLTRAFQNEIMKMPQVYLGNRLKIVVAECIKKNDDIRYYCDGLSRQLKEMVKKYSNTELIVEEISSVNEFKQMLQRHDDTSILVVSAHGCYHSESNMAGLVIGDEIWMADDNDIKFPPVVLLSACHVMPRGKGVVSVGDLFIRSGAVAVLGTYIPIDVRRNAMLIVRLFIDILEVRNGWSEMRTLDQIWCHVVGSNAIHEIIAPISSKHSKLEEWANTPNKNGVIPQAEFKLKNSVNRLRLTHVYEDTEAILREMAHRDGIGAYYDSYINTNGYFPESVFYQLVGMPENIFIRNSVMEQYCAKQE